MSVAAEASNILQPLKDSLMHLEIFSSYRACHALEGKNLVINLDSALSSHLI